ncbi:MAG: 16S rRNA (guanine(527)-N(7))-methyltransferase RsmG [Candidatus Cloacimonetes bacterium]|nr:16S rRNA (guanine(527)-N(7))-methyltransferase RsmG [Candidatus Cloacimonadota bacterium]
MKKQAFIDFIREQQPERSEELISKFEELHEYLLDENSRVNLISRKTPDEDYWTLHLLDSILPIQEFDFSDKKILDFGSGGGLPGIPLNIIFPTSQIYCLDSRKKKMSAVKNIIKRLDLKKCFTIVSRLEDLDSEWFGEFDVIVCRSVKILPEYREKMMSLLKDGGKIILYKSKLMDDVEQFANVKIHDLSHPEIGTRKIIEITK